MTGSDDQQFVITLITCSALSLSRKGIEELLTTVTSVMTNCWSSLPVISSSIPFRDRDRALQVMSDEKKRKTTQRGYYPKDCISFSFL